MKTYKLLWPVMALCLLAYGFGMQDMGWTNVKNKTALTAATASKVKTFDASDPESVARYFYASRVRKNQEWRKVVHLPESEWTIKMKSAMNEYSKWTFKTVALQKKRNLFEGEVHFMLFYEATAGGKPKKATGEMIVQKVKEKWVVHEVPY